MPDEEIRSDHPLYLKGIAYFNEYGFFEAHDVWEELWADYQGPSRKFLQGLIQVAVCLHHFNNGNIRGARKLYHSSRNYLQPYRPTHLDLQLDELLDSMQVCCSAFADSEEQYPQAELDVDKIPQIRLDPPQELPEVELDEDD